MRNFGINGGVPWLTNTDVELCLLCKESVEDVSHFLLDCPNFRDNRESLWSNLNQKVTACNLSDVMQISRFFNSLDREQKILLLLGGLHLPFDQAVVNVVKMFISSTIGKIQRLRKEMLRELEVPWLPN